MFVSPPFFKKYSICCVIFPPHAPLFFRTCYISSYFISFWLFWQDFFLIFPFLLLSKHSSPCRCRLCECLFLHISAYFSADFLGSPACFFPRCPVKPTSLDDIFFGSKPLSRFCHPLKYFFTSIGSSNGVFCLSTILFYCSYSPFFNLKSPHKLFKYFPIISIVACIIGIFKNISLVWNDLSFSKGHTHKGQNP